MCGAEVIRADALVSALCYFSSIILSFGCFKIRSAMHVSSQGITYTWTEWEHCR